MSDTQQHEEEEEEQQVEEAVSERGKEDVEEDPEVDEEEEEEEGFIVMEGKEEVPANTYAKYLELSKKEDLSKIKQMDFLSQHGRDKLGRPIVMIVAAHLNLKTGIDLDQLLRFIIYTMDAIVENDYSIMFVHSCASSANRCSRWLLFDAFAHPFDFPDLLCPG